MIPYKIVNVISVQDWDEAVIQLYGKPYSLQQQDGCMSAGTLITIRPTTTVYDYEEEPYLFEDSDWHEGHSTNKCKTFGEWVSAPLGMCSDDTEWEREFYPDVDHLANALCIKGLIEPGEYVIKIDW